MLVTMNDSDIYRFKVIQVVSDRRIRRVDAADILDLSVRQVQRLMNRLREFGAVGLTHQARGKPSNNRYPSDYRDTVLKLIRGTTTKQTSMLLLSPAHTKRSRARA